MRLPARRPSWKLFFPRLCALFMLTSCGASLAVRAAQSGNQASLRSAIAQERSTGKLDRGRVLDIAREVARREIRGSSPPEAIAQIEEARGCARPLDDALESRARQTDDVGATAKLTLLDSISSGSERQGEDLQRRYGGSPNPLWRAVAARAATGGELAAPRRRFDVDPDERVRLAALRAGLERAERTDAPILLDVARRDPNPLAQSLAVRALGPVADSGTVLALRDLFATADEGLRQSIVDAWGHREAASAGGLREIIRVAEGDRGAPAIEAGSVLQRFKTEQDAAAIGTRALVRGIGTGIARDRVLAIMDAPLADPAVGDALRKSARSEEPAVKAASLVRLSEDPATRSQALLELWAMQKAGLRIGLLALARARVPEAGHLLEQDLSSKDAATRLSAMRALVGLGQVTGAADLLADDDARVRMATACTMLAAPR
jgi:hypothetical protein